MCLKSQYLILFWTEYNSQSDIQSLLIHSLHLIQSTAPLLADVQSLHFMQFAAADRLTYQISLSMISSTGIFLLLANYNLPLILYRKLHWRILTKVTRSLVGTAYKT